MTWQKTRVNVEVALLLIGQTIGAEQVPELTTQHTTINITHISSFRYRLHAPYDQTGTKNRNPGLNNSKLWYSWLASWAMSICWSGWVALFHVSPRSVPTSSFEGEGGGAEK